LAEAEQAGAEASQRIAGGKQSILELANKDREAYQRAIDILAPFDIFLDFAAQECAETRSVLNGTGTPMATCQDCRRTPRIGCVTRAGDVVLPYQIEIDVERVHASSAHFIAALSLTRR
jgi:hypothetical protein